MLDNFLAEKFIEKAKELTEYNVNIMDEKGKIIASKDPDRIGSFHEVAYWIIHGEEEIIEVPEENNEYLGVKNGVMMPIVHKGKRVGAIGLTGEPEQVRQIGKVMRFAIETMYDFEFQHAQSARRQNIKERFINSILYNEEADRERLLEDASSLGWDESRLRIPIYLSVGKEVDTGVVIRKLKESAYYNTLDILAVAREQKIILFKSFERDLQVLGQYREIISECIANCRNYLEQEGAAYQFCVGTFQSRFENYVNGYRHCLWMGKYTKEKGVQTDEKLVYFYDWVQPYMKEMVSLMEYRDIFGVYEELMDHKVKDNFIQVIESLHRNNYNFNASSKELYIHKNTLVFRYNKIREMLDVNPMQQVCDREFLEYLEYYIRNNRK